MFHMTDVYVSLFFSIKSDVVFNYFFPTFECSCVQFFFFVYSHMHKQSGERQLKSLIVAHAEGFFLLYLIKNQVTIIPAVNYCSAIPHFLF